MGKTGEFPSCTYNSVTGNNEWDAIPAVQNNQVFEIKSAVILQPGPAALSEGVQQIRAVIKRWAARQELASDTL